MQVIEYDSSTVLVKDGDIEAWVDVWVKDGEVCCDWNQYIFYPKDKELQVWQNNPDNFDKATSLAIQTLEEAGHIKYINNKWFSV